MGHVASTTQSGGVKRRRKRKRRRSTTLDPHLDRYSVEEGRVRLALRRQHDDSTLHGQWLVIEAIASQFHDARVKAGCIQGGKLRRDRLHVEAFLLRHHAKMSRAQVAASMGLRLRYARFSIERGHRLLEQAREDGRLDAPLASIGTTTP